MAKAASDSYKEHRDNAHILWYVGVCQQTGEPKPSEYLEPRAIDGFKAALSEYRGRLVSKLGSRKAEQQ